MTFPAVQGTTAVSGSGTSVTTFVVSLPSGIVSGELLLMHLAVNSSAVVTTPSGWNLLGNDAISGQLGDYVFYRTADGTEGASVSVTSTSATFEAVVRRINNWGSIEATAFKKTASNVTSQTPNAITPSYGSLDSLFFIIGSLAGGTSSINFPAGYTTDQQSVVTSGSHRAVSAGKTNTAATETPGSVSWTASSNVEFITVAIKRGPATTNQSVSATTTTATAFLRSAGKQVTITSATALAAIRSITRTVLAASSTSSSVRVSVGKIATAAVSSAAAFTRSIGKTVSSAATSVANATAIRAILVTISATISSAASISKQAATSLAAAVGSVASRTLSIGKVLAVSNLTSSVISAVRAYLIAVGVTLSGTVMVLYPKNILTAVSASLSTTASVAKATAKGLSMAISSTAAIRKSANKAVAIALSLLVSIRRISSRLGRAVRSIIFFWH